MYEELGSVREPVALSSAEALASAEELLRRQGYRVIHRTGVMVVGKREDPSDLVNRQLVHLAVFARPHPEGGLLVTLQGDDRDGVRERKSEWSRWAESLPKFELEKKERERATGTTPPAEMVQMRPQRSETEATTEIGGPPERVRRREELRASELHSNAVRPQPTAGGAEVKGKSSGSELEAWKSVPPWERNVRTVPGKFDRDTDKPAEGPTRR
jgi:hypothetical protein